MSKTENVPKQRSLRVLRGCSWFFFPAQVAARCDVDPGSRSYFLGVRLVEVLDE